MTVSQISPRPDPGMVALQLLSQSTDDERLAADPVGFAEVFEQRQQSGGDPARRQTTAFASEPTARFIDGALFGYATGLSGSQAEAARGGGTVGQAGDDGTDAAAQEPAHAETMGSAIPGNDLPAVQMTLPNRTSLAASSAMAEPMPVAGEDAAATDAEVVDEAFPAPPVETGEAMPPDHQGLAMPGLVDAEQSEATMFAGVSDGASDAREAHVETLSWIHVAAAMGAEGAGANVVARISGLDAGEETMAERTMCSTAAQSAGAGTRLRLNGTDRNDPLRNLA